MKLYQKDILNTRSCFCVTDKNLNINWVADSMPEAGTLIKTPLNSASKSAQRQSISHPVNSISYYVFTVKS